MVFVDSREMSDKVSFTSKWRRTIRHRRDLNRSRLDDAINLVFISRVAGICAMVIRNNILRTSILTTW